jgi:hypothetical protein
MFVRGVSASASLLAHRWYSSEARDAEKAMKCRNCKKEMTFVQNIEKLTEILLPTPEERAAAMERQVILCEHCEQPYGYTKKRKKLALVALTPKWLSKQPEPIQKSMAQAISEAKKGLELVRLNEYWTKRMESIKV